MSAMSSDHRKSVEGQLWRMEEPKPSKLPKHVQDLMFGPKGRRKMPRHYYKPTGIVDNDEMNDVMSSLPKMAPWLVESQAKLTSIQAEKKFRPSVIRRTKQATEGKVKEKRDKYSDYNKMIQLNPYNKIAFINNQTMRDIVPQWCQERLRTACRSARFELPFDKTILEMITPLQFLARYTRLYREQRRRYANIFQKHKSKANDYIDYSNLYPALNSMFGLFLGKENFDILCTALFIDRETALDETTFVGVCTFTDRLFWTSYLEHLDRDTFTFLGPNRSVLEYADFENLRRKIDGLKLSKEMFHLLYSLA